MTDVKPAADPQTSYPSAPDPFAPTATTTSTAPADLMTEQEKDTASETKGVGPASASEGSPGPVETMEMLGIGPREPYPEGSPPPPSDADLANIEAAKKEPAAKPAPYEPAAKGGA